jgi:hypothetical protein
MKSRNTTLAQELNSLLNQKFPEPFYELIEMIEDNAYFNYANYYNRREYEQGINEETEFLIRQKSYLKNKGYRGFLFIADYVITIK